MTTPNAPIISTDNTSTLPSVRRMVPRHTGKLVRITRTTRLSSAHLGNCEICDQHMTEAFHSRVGREMVRANGTVYIEHTYGGVYAHESCIAKAAEND